MLPTDLLEKAMRPALLGIIGCGAMGRLIARHIREQLPSYRLGGLFSRTTAHAEGLALELGDVPVLGLQQLIETCDLLVEATSAAAMPDIVRACLAAGKAVVPLSVGGFSLDPALLRDVEAARAALEAAPGVEVMDDTANKVYPMPGLLAGTDGTFVGRLRKDPTVSHGIAFWDVADQIRKGAALNAVQIAQLLLP